MSCSASSSSSLLVKNLRQLMLSKRHFPELVHAYIVPTTDPHRVRSARRNERIDCRLSTRTNTWLIDTNDESSFPSSQDRTVRLLGVVRHWTRRDTARCLVCRLGTAVITLDRALLWTDGRYFAQAERELDETCWTLMREGQADVPSMSKWLSRVSNDRKEKGREKCFGCRI